jgi:hypothetical protein
MIYYLVSILISYIIYIDKHNIINKDKLNVDDTDTDDNIYLENYLNASLIDVINININIIFFRVL